MIFKSKLYREEIKHWILIVSLILWALLASIFALKNNSKTILIGIDENGSKIITDTNERILQNELKNFLKTFLLTYYGYDEKSYSSQIESASNLMSLDLWDKSKAKLIEQKEKLQKVPLTQIPEIESIDQIEQGKIEAILNLNINARLNQQKVKLKVRISYSKASRTELNPWGFEVAEVSDVVL